MVIYAVRQKSRRLAPALVPAFKPVPRRYRHDGWTPERQRAFIEALADTGSVRHAAARVGMASENAYALRRARGAEQFAAAWQAALDHGIRQLEDIAMGRAIHGQEVPVYSYGKLIGTRRVFNDRLIMFLLRNRAVDRFPASASQAAIQFHERLKWRREEDEAPDLDEVRMSILRRIEAIERHDKRNEAARLAREAQENEVGPAVEAEGEDSATGSDASAQSVDVRPLPRCTRPI